MQQLLIVLRTYITCKMVHDRLARYLSFWTCLVLQLSMLIYTCILLKNQPVFNQLKSVVNNLHNMVFPLFMVTHFAFGLLIFSSSVWDKTYWKSICIIVLSSDNGFPINQANVLNRLSTCVIFFLLSFFLYSIGFCSKLFVSTSAFFKFTFSNLTKVICWINSYTISHIVRPEVFCYKILGPLGGK